jgi:hypothetical protein
MSEPTEIVQRVTRALACSACGAAGEANCDCGAPYLPASARAAKAIIENPGRSDRSIAAEIGVSDRTVNRARATATHDAVGSRIGLDGKARKRPIVQKARPPRTIKPDPYAVEDLKELAEILPPKSYQNTLYEKACLLLEEMTDATRQKFFAHLKGKYLNALGKPLSPSYDPKYKVKTPLTSINRLRVKPPKIRDAPPPDIGSEHVRDFRALDDADEHVIEYYSVMEEAISNSPAPEVAEMMKVALDDGADPGPMPESLRRATA